MYLDSLHIPDHNFSEIWLCDQSISILIQNSKNIDQILLCIFLRLHLLHDNDELTKLNGSTP